MRVVVCRKEGISVAFRQSDGGSIAAVIIPQAQHKANLERIRQLEAAAYGKLRRHLEARAEGVHDFL